MARSLSQALNKTTSNNPRLLPARNHSTFPEPPVIYHGYKDPNGVKKCQPNWLPLRPGFSYWAPPNSNSGHHDHHFIKGEVAPTSSKQNMNRSDDDDKSS